MSTSVGISQDNSENYYPDLSRVILSQLIPGYESLDILSQLIQGYPNLLFLYQDIPDYPDLLRVSLSTGWYGGPVSPRQAQQYKALPRWQYTA